ncbi:MAG TPA: phage major capsid protein [Acidimicrobiales bacterium]|nr:phage major capsid protein [Acidimicrobiales bacterium]
MFTYAKRLVDERDHLTEMAHSTAERAASEERDLTDTERASIKSWQERCAAIDVQLEEHKATIESQRSWSALRAKLDEPDPPATSNPRRNGSTSLPEVRSWGGAFTDSEEFRSYGGRGSSGQVQMPFGLFERAAADPIALADYGNLVSPFRWEPPVPTFRNPLLEVIGRQPVSVGSVEYFYFKPHPPSEAEVVAEGDEKPPAEFEIQEKAAALKTYAHWKAVTRQALEDYARIRTIVEDKLRGGLLRALESAVTADLLANTDIPDREAANLLEAIRGGVADVETNGYTANAVALNPQDWAGLDIAVLAATFNGPVLGRTFWGLTPVAAPAIPSGTAYVGDFSTGITLFDRNVTNVFLSDSHADFFVRNLLIILAETRALAVVTEPLALVKATAATV